MPPRECAKCGWSNTGVLQGVIVGLCGFCTKEISEAAKDMGVYLGARKPVTIRGREIVVKGVSLFWWEHRWRVMKVGGVEK